MLVCFKSFLVAMAAVAAVAVAAAVPRRRAQAAPRVRSPACQQTKNGLTTSRG